MNDEDFDDVFEGNAGDAPEAEIQETEAVVETEEVTETEEVEAEPVEQTETAETEDDLEREIDRVPVGALLNARDKLREEKRLREERERELQELRDQMARQQAPQQYQQPSIPDPYDDPQGFAAYNQQLIYQAVMQERWNNSNIAAVAAHGEDTVAAARNWAAERAKSDPAFEQEAMAQSNPVAWLVEKHTRHARLAEFETDPDAWFEKEAAKRGMNFSHSPMAAAPLAHPTQTAPKAAAPVSLATVSSNKARPAQTGKDDFDDVFTFKR